jgi:cell division septum initiation protein DivIVA
MSERAKILRRDFPTEERGYDPSAVDGHLAALADELERDQATDERDPLSQHLSSILEAAEHSRSRIEEQAGEAAAAKQAETSSQAKEALEAAKSDAAGHIGYVVEHTTAMRERLDAVGREMAAVLDAVRAGAGRLEDHLAGLQARVAELSAKAAVSPEEPAPMPAPADGGLAAGERDADTPAQDGDGVDASAANPVETARLIALNMALSGAPREATDRYIAENFELPDREGLVDDVYGSIKP